MSINEERKIGKNDWLTISEFSAIVGIPVSKLRYYDEHGILVPDKRDTSKKNSFRYYSPKQITIAKMVKVLREIGIPLSEIKELGKTRSPEKLVKLFARYKKILTYKIDAFSEDLSVINIFNSQIIDGLTADENDISVVPMAEISIALGSKTNFVEGDEFYNEYKKFCQEPRNPEINLLYPVGGYFESFESFSDHPSKPDRFFSLDPRGRERRARGSYLIGYTRGYYGETNDLPERLTAYAKEHKHELIGPVYNTYLFDEISMPDTEEYLLQVAVLIDDSEYK